MVKKVRMGLQDFTTLSQKQVAILTQSGVLSIPALADLTPIELKTLLDTTISRAVAILKEARENLPPFKIQTGKMILELNKTRNYLSTNCKAIDALLGGRGIESGSITEVFAQFGTGKSQFAFSCIASALLKKPGTLGGSVIVIDTEGTCSPERIKEILEFYKDQLDQSPEDALENVKIIRPESSAEQKTIIKLFLEEGGFGYLKYIPMKKPLKLLIVDSLSGLFRAEFIGRGTLAERQQKLNEYMRDLYLFGVKNQIPILVTNQVISSPDPFNPKDVAVGGNVVAHASTYRISMHKRKNFRVAKMEDSSRLPANEVVFKLGKRGIIDVEDEDFTPEEYFKNIEEEKGL